MKSLLIGFTCVSLVANAAPGRCDEASHGDSKTWQQKSVEYARIMSRVKWTPVADGMPKRGGHFTAGQEYTGVPYSSVKHVGRYIGFDIFLKTFLAAVENPQSVLYTENLYGKVSNAECYYGKVCTASPISMRVAGATGQNRFCFQTTQTTRQPHKSIASCFSIAATGFPAKRGNP